MRGQRTHRDDLHWQVVGTVPCPTPDCRGTVRVIVHGEHADPAVQYSGWFDVAPGGCRVCDTLSVRWSDDQIAAMGRQVAPEAVK